MPDRVIPRTATLDLVIAGAARCGTSFLAAQLGTHPNIDAGSIKEPNFFSRNYERGIGWYEGLFQPRQDDLFRMDASVSYTFPHFPEALNRLALHAPAALVVYVVRDPIPRTVSHYLYHRYYFKQENAPDFGMALAANQVYAGTSDYQRWLAALQDRFSTDQILVVPFSAVAEGEVAARVWARMHLPPTEDQPQVEAHRNNVVTFKHEAFRVASRKLRRSRFYPMVRERIGADRLRKLRSLVTRETSLPSVEQALSSCSPEQLHDLREMERRSNQAVTDYLTEQDQRLGSSWLSYWPAGATGE